MGSNPYANNSLAQNVQGAGTQAGATYADMLSGQGPLARTNLSPYMNPFTQSVVNTSMGELGHQQALQSNALANQATQANAFGGDRSAIQQAENDRNWNAQKATTASNLYNTGFNTAQGAAQNDINTQMNAASGLSNMANMGFGMGQQLQQNQLAAGAMQQSQMQKIMDAIKSQYQGFTGQGAQGLNNMISALQGMFNPQQSNSSSSGSSMQLGMPSGK